MSRPPGAALNAGCTFEKCSVRPLLQLRCHSPVHRLTDFREAFLETGKRSRRKVAIIFNRVPAVFDTAHVGLVFTDVMWHGHCGARIFLRFEETQGPVSDAQMPGRSWAPAREPNSLFEAIVPTDGTRAANMRDRDFGTRRFTAGSRTSRCLPVSLTWGVQK